MVRKNIRPNESTKKRKFDGRTMMIWARYSTKAEAKKEAEASRSRGEWARVVKSNKGYEVYNRTKPSMFQRPGGGGSRGSFTWAKERDNQAVRINNKTKETEFFRKDRTSGEWRSTTYPFKSQPKSVQRKAAEVSRKKIGYNINKAFEVLGMKPKKRKK